MDEVRFLIQKSGRVRSNQRLHGKVDLDQWIKNTPQFKATRWSMNEELVAEVKETWTMEVKGSPNERAKEASRLLVSHLVQS